MDKEDGKAENASGRQARSLRDMMFSPSNSPSLPHVEEEKPTSPPPKVFSEDEMKKIVSMEKQKYAEQMQKEMQQQEKPKADSEWKTFQKMGMNMPDVLETDYEHRAWLLTSKFLDKPTIQLHDLALKELRIANLQDTEQALIYAFKMDCVEDWLSLDYGDLAKQRLLHMIFRLGLSVSVDARELTLQHGQSSVSMSIPMGEQSYTGLPEEDEAPKKRINIRKFLNKINSAAG